MVGLVLAFGAGALISAVAYELLGEAVFERDTSGVVLGLLAGALVYVLGDIFITRAGGGERKGAEAEEDSSGLAIVLGTVLDGIPESFVLGLTLIGGNVSLAFVAAVFVSNLPEAIGATSSLASSGWKAARIMAMWVGLATVCIVFAMLGYAVFESAEDATGQRVEAFAAGAMLAMLADTMMPEGFKQGGNWAGMATVFGFILAVTLRLAE
jgi:ZIP family zinc transporter